MKSVVFVGLACVLACGCSETGRSVDERSTNDALLEPFEVTILENGEPSHVAVQHILVAFYGSLPDRPIRRSKARAQELANELRNRAIAGKDFDELVKVNTDDEPPGIYQLANKGQPADMSSSDRSSWILPRTKMVSAFGDVSFSLNVGEIGIAEYDPATSPYGWHVIKRIK